MQGSFIRVLGMRRLTVVVFLTMVGHSAHAQWEFVFTNPDAPEGFFDAIQFEPGFKCPFGYVLGDPVAGKFAMFGTQDSGRTWWKFRDYERASARDGEAVFAASNSSLLEVRGRTLFVTGGSRSRSRTIEENQKHDPFIFYKFIGGNLPRACRRLGLDRDSRIYTTRPGTGPRSFWRSGISNLRFPTPDSKRRIKALTPRN
jgi:hypothetical protein